MDNECRIQPLVQESKNRTLFLLKKILEYTIKTENPEYLYFSRENPLISQLSLKNPVSLFRENNPAEGLEIPQKGINPSKWKH